MFYTYVLVSLKNRKLYIGYTDNLKKRIKEHNEGNGSAFTQKNRPYTLVFYEAFVSKSDATKQERFYKTGYGREVLQGKIDTSLKNIFARLVHR